MLSLRVLSMLLATAAIGIAVGCGGDDDEDTPAATTAPSEQEAGGGEAQTVEMSEFEFTPDDLSVKQGDTITADNAGTTVHNLTIEAGPDPEKASEELAATPDVDAGQSGDVTVDVDPGEYSLVCTIANHRELGMVGTIKVE